MGSSLRHEGSFLEVCGLFVVVHGLLSSCGMQVPEPMGSVVCGMQALAEARKLSIVAFMLSCPVACEILVP